MLAFAGWVGTQARFLCGDNDDDTTHASSAWITVPFTHRSTHPRSGQGISSPPILAWHPSSSFNTTPKQFFHLPGEIYSATNPLEALSTVPLLSHMQIFLCACLHYCVSGSIDGRPFDF